MATWSKICDVLEKYANRKNEMTYQKSIIDLLLEMNLGWHKNQLTEQLSIQLGSTKRLIPDIVITKDDRNKFVIEVKEPAHVITQENIDQLVSYMKQLETPVGIYIGRELKVYFKNLGDGSEPKLIMSLEFKEDDENGDDFMTLFSESEFSIAKVIDYTKAYEKKMAFESNVNELVAKLLSPDFKEELKIIIGNHFSDKGDEIVSEAMKAISIDIKSSLKNEEMRQTVTNVSKHDSSSTQSSHRIKIRHRGGNNGIAQRYAYNLIKGIIEKNPNLNFKSLYDIFGYKNYIEDITNISDETRWFMDEEDIITLADGTRIVISNQWGFYNNSKKKMDRLREKASKFGLDVTLP
ncbi:MAG: type I restriction enzyme HsdR N-terminal domain-containing protein [Bacteroides sp.]|nr:type I restriction enzyme HsdR N-terminal domain-containing protein [Bacteroides sp.]